MRCASTSPIWMPSHFASIAATRSVKEHPPTAKVRPPAAATNKPKTPAACLRLPGEGRGYSDYRQLSIIAMSTFFRVASG